MTLWIYQQLINHAFKSKPIAKTISETCIIITPGSITYLFFCYTWQTQTYPQVIKIYSSLIAPQNNLPNKNSSSLVRRKWRYIQVWNLSCSTASHARNTIGTVIVWVRWFNFGLEPLFQFGKESLVLLVQEQSLLSEPLVLFHDEAVLQVQLCVQPLHFCCLGIRANDHKNLKKKIEKLQVETKDMLSCTITLPKK